MKKGKWLFAAVAAITAMLTLTPLEVKASSTLLTEEQMGGAELVKYGTTYGVTREGTYYQLQVEGDGYLTFEASGHSVDIALYSKNGERVLRREIETVYEKNNTGSCSLGLEKGEYYLLVGHGYDERYDNEIQLKILYTKDAYCEKEPNDATKQAQKLELVQWYKGFPGECYGELDIDYYKFPVEDGKMYAVTFQFETDKPQKYLTRPEIVDKDTRYTTVYTKKNTSLENDEVENIYIFQADGSGDVWVKATKDETDKQALDYSIKVDTYSGWLTIENKLYWYEDGVRQGYDPKNKAYRGKEIYDPETDAWYWLDNVQKGAVAVSKDVYQESLAGPYADREDGTGKWVRYDEKGLMVKGWSEKNGDKYYFDETYGAMLKGWHCLEGEYYYFNPQNGILELTGGCENGWWSYRGKSYWYENGVRQGFDSTDGAYRGKEIYDKESDAWYWLDNVQQGAKAVSKDVYQESEAGVWADRTDGTGKWVRYDENGHMVKGWSITNNGKYYFDTTYGTMAKGEAVIDGIGYYFNEQTGVLETLIN